MHRLLILITAAFALFTAAILSHTGLIGFYRALGASVATWQVLADISIALGLVLTWMWHDARATGRRFWPWVVATLVLGSFGPLLYLIGRPARAGGPA